MAIRPVTVRILHPDPGPDAGPLERWVATARSNLAERHCSAFVDAGAADAGVLHGPPDDTPFGARLRAIVRADRPTGLVVLGSGAIPLAVERDYGDLVAAAAVDDRAALANNRFSADVVAIARAEALAAVPDLDGDNALPRWLTEVAGYAVGDLRRRWWLGFDIDGPLELVLLGGTGTRDGVDLDPIRARLDAVRAIASDRRAELTIAGRTSVRTIAWLERGIAARVRAIVEERGLRAASPLAQDPPGTRTGQPAVRAPASLLGLLLDHAGPGSIGDILSRLGDASIIDTRVLLAHRLGADEAGWPTAEDRFASDLSLPDRIHDPWLRELTTAALAAPIPILLGGHSLVGPGARLLLGRNHVRRSSWT